ncbi:alpha/beta hydrolase family protein [Zhongshania sp.]|jgi:predicted dienelactone hydrolase|uniref:alpha/beta hydrolase family protein n=1 Tax=Zhongshania sp. TaxID=1971902 RepID=UPI0039E22EC7
MFKKILLSLLVLLLASGAYLQFGNLPQPLSADTEGSRWLEKGIYDVSYFDVELVDDTRPTQKNGEYLGSNERQLQTRIWYPEDLLGAAPLLIYSHGFMSSRTGGSYLAEHFASHGYIVAAMDYPLTTMGAPGGPLVKDVVSQPGDVSFLIDQFVSWNADSGNQFYERIDDRHIGVMGLSLGGMTSTLATFHPRSADLRISAAVSIAGPVFMFGPAFYDSRDVPFMMIASPIDAMIDYQTNAATILPNVKGAVVVTMNNASHTGFASPGRYLRWFENPDSLGCGMLTRGLEKTSDENWASELGESEEGILLSPQTALCTTDPLPPTMNPVRQQWLTTLAVFPFFESQFALSELRRQEARDYLFSTFSSEIPEVSVARAIK